MTNDNFSAVDDYFVNLFAPADGVFAEVMKNCDEAEPRFEVTAIQTVGSKGHDGFALGIVE